MSKPSVVFFGTGPVAAKSLESLLSDFEVKAVITKPQPTHHKEEFPVTTLAHSNKLPVYEISNKAELSELFKTQNFNSKVGLVIDFGIIINKDVLDYFPLGIVNSHFSLLPQWRGPDPITFSLLSGQEVTGVSIMLISEKMDEGMLIAQEEYKISETINIEELTSDLIDLSIKLLSESLPKYIESKIWPYAQDLKSKPTYSTFLKKSDGLIDLTKPAETLEREVRAYLGWPGSKTTLKLKDRKELEIIVTEAEVTPSPSGEGWGEGFNNPLTLKTSKDYLKITKLKLPGKQEMTAKDFLNGYKSKLN